MLPMIEVDTTKCPDPLGCRKCLVVCPTRVLGLGTSVAQKKYQETDPSHYFVGGVRFQVCTACMKCVEICPNGAIQVTLDRGVAA